MALTLIVAGLMAGVVNYFYVYLNLPTVKESPNLTLEEGSPQWEMPKLTYWLALTGYLIIGLAGAFLTPLIDAMVDLKGSPQKPGDSWDGWILLGYGIVFGFSTNRLLSSMVGSILSKLNSLEKNRMANMQLQTNSNTRNLSSTTSSDQLLILADDLEQGEHWPSNKSEVQASGAFTAKIIRGTAEFKALKTNNNADIVFKDEERTGADKMMNGNLFNCINNLSDKVKTEWKEGAVSAFKLRITEAWDENDEHGTNSLHYEARAADVNLWDIKNSRPDTSKLGRLAALATECGFDWVFYEDASHVHVSCKKA